MSRRYSSYQSPTAEKYHSQRRPANPFYTQDIKFFQDKILADLPSQAEGKKIIVSQRYKGSRRWGIRMTVENKHGVWYTLIMSLICNGATVDSWEMPPNISNVTPPRDYAYWMAGQRNVIKERLRGLPL